jgi:hypothetical protein
MYYLFAQSIEINILYINENLFDLVFEKLFVLKKHIKYLKKDCRFKRKLD